MEEESEDEDEDEDEDDYSDEEDYDEYEELVRPAAGRALHPLHSLRT